MSASSRIADAAAGLLRTRWLVRGPVWLSRARLGILLGPRFLMLVHAPATARIFPQAEAAAALAAYSARHPRAWAGIKSVLRGTLGGPADDVESRLPVVALELGRAG